MDKVASVIANLNDRRVPYEVSLIYGLPGKPSIRASEGWCLETGVPRVRAWPLMLLAAGLHDERVGGAMWNPRATASPSSWRAMIVP